MADEAKPLLETEHLVEDLGGRAMRGGASIVAVQTTQFALSLGATAALARLLAPTDFGLVALGVTVGDFLGLFLDLGLGAATVQRASLDKSQISMLFWINAALGTLIAAVMAATAPLVARFYGHPELVGVNVVLALGFLLTGFSVQHTALLRRQMRLTRLSGIELVSLTLGIGLAWAIAALGAGYWALVCLQLAPQAFGLIGVWSACRWRPGRPDRSVDVRPWFSFGAGLTGFNVLNYFSRNLDNVIIGRVSGTAALGLYVKSYSLLLLPVTRIRVPASAVVIPALSRLQDDPLRFRRFFLAAITIVVAIGMPLVVFMFVLAPDVILFVLGPQWQGSVILFQVLAPAAFVETFNTVGSWTCMPFGRSARLVRWQIFATAVMATSFLVGARWGVLGVAWAVSLSTVALRAPSIVYLLRESPVRPIDLLEALARPAGASLIAGAILYALRSSLLQPLNGFPLLGIAVPVFGVLYLSLWMLLPGGRRVIAELLTVREAAVS